MQVLLPSKEKKLRFETQLTLNGARSPSVRKSFSAGQKQPRVVRLNWKGAWRISAAGEIPVDHPENFRWNGEMALGGDLVYASGETNVALQKPTFSVRVEKQVVSISDFKAGLWEGSLNRAEDAGLSAFGEEESAIRNAVHNQGRPTAIDHQQFWRRPDGAWCRAMRLEGRR